MGLIINIAGIRNKKIKAQQIEFKNDKDYYTIKAYDTTAYDRAKAKKQTEKLRREYER